MPLPTILDPSRPLTPPDLAAFEQQHGIVIPAPYRAFLLTANGGSPSPENFTVQMEPRPHVRRLAPDAFLTAVEFFLSLDDEHMSILAIWPYVTEQRLQPGMFPVAYCGGDLLCLFTRPETRDQVFYWFSDEEYDFEATGDQNLYFVADSLAALLAVLHD